MSLVHPAILNKRGAASTVNAHVAHSSIRDLMLLLLQVFNVLQSAKNFSSVSIDALVASSVQRN